MITLVLPQNGGISRYLCLREPHSLSMLFRSEPALWKVVAVAVDVAVAVAVVVVVAVAVAVAVAGH